MSLGLGKILKNRRVEKNLTLKDVEDQIKVRTKYIEAFENEEYDKLPAIVYSRGILRSYTKLLGLDELAILKLYESNVKNEDEKVEIKPPAEEEKKEAEKVKVKAKARETKTRKRKNNGKNIIIFILLAFVAINLVFLLKDRPTKVVDEKNNPSQLEDKLETEPKEDEKTEEKEEAVIDELKLNLKIIGEDKKAWIRCVSDGKVVFEEVLVSGDEKEILAKEKISLRIGNAGVVHLKMGEEDLGLAGDLNQVVDKEFILEDFLKE